MTTPTKLGFFAALLSLALLGCAPAATAGARTWTAQALESLRAAAEAAPAEGLPPQIQSLAELERLAASRTSQAPGDRVDVAADALFDSLARSFASGVAAPRRVDQAWTIPPPSSPNLMSLHGAIAAGAAPDVLLRALLPQSREYLALHAELARVVAEPPGALNSAGLGRELRIALLRANMERWRWLPRTMPQTRIEVRIPAQQVLFFKDEAVVSSHAVIVGARRTPTPTIAAELRSVTLNPDWTPPANILRQELLPRFQRNPAAAAREGFDALDAGGAVVDPAAIDWNARPFPYRLRQRPGAANALGRIRFDLPNAYAIYLHDTPNHALFGRTHRALSHGCIRVDDPIGLAASVLQDPNWTEANLQAAIDTDQQLVLSLTQTAPVYILYLTAAIGDDGAIAYYDDLYDRDPKLIAALEAPDAAFVADNDQPQEHCPA